MNRSYSFLVNPSSGGGAAPEAVVERARRFQVVCAERGIALGAAALQFAMKHPAVTTVLVGARSAAEVTVDVGFAAAPLLRRLWA